MSLGNPASVERPAWQLAQGTTIGSPIAFVWPVSTPRSDCGVLMCVGYRCCVRASADATLDESSPASWMREGRPSHPGASEQQANRMRRGRSMREDAEPRALRGRFRPRGSNEAWARLRRDRAQPIGSRIVALPLARGLSDADSSPDAALGAHFARFRSRVRVAEIVAAFTTGSWGRGRHVEWCARGSARQ